MQVEYFEQVLREAHSHPGVEGIVMFTTRSEQNCSRLCLIDENYKNLPAGEVVDKLLQEWGMKKLSGTTDQNGFFEASLFHGDYQVEINHPREKNYTLTKNLQVIPIDESQKSTQVVQLSI